MDPVTLLALGLVAIAGSKLLGGATRASRAHRGTPRRHAARPAAAPARASAGESTEALARRLERGQYRPDELRSLVDSGAISFSRRRNPLVLGALTLAHHRAPRRNPCPGGEQAHMQSEAFHGEAGEVLCLHGRPHVVLGKAESLTYRPPASSKRGRWSWEHAFGDQGDGKPRLRGRPLVVADAETGQVELAGGPARFEPGRGIVG